MQKIFLLFFFLGCSLTISKAQTYTLSQCREMALQHNEDLRKAGIGEERALLDKQTAFSNYLPTLDGMLNAIEMKNQKFSGMELLMHGTYLAGITLTQPLYVGGKIHTANRLARVGQKVAQEQLRLERQQCIADVDKAFFALVSVRSKVQMLESLNAQLDSLTAQVQTTLKADMATQADLLRIQTKKSETDYNLQKARNGEVLCRMVLCSTIGLELGTEMDIEMEEDITIANPGTDISQRPEIALLNTAIEAKQLQVRMAQAELLPTIALSLGYTYYGNLKMRGMATAPDGNSYSYEQRYKDGIPMASLSIQIPLFHLGDYKRVKQARLDVQSAQLDLQKSQRLMNIEVQQAQRNFDDAQRLLRTASLGLQQADESLRIMRLRHTAQLATIIELLDAESQWLQARSNFIEAKSNLYLSQTDLLRVTGQLGD